MVLAKVAGDVGHHSQIEQGNTTVISDENVAGVRVGVEETVHQHLFQIGAKDLLRQGPRIQLHQTQRTDVGNLFAGNVIHREHPRRGVVLNRLRDNYVFEFAQAFAKSSQVARLALEIQFVKQTLTQISEHVREFV